MASCFSESVRIGGDRFDEAIVGYVRRRFGTLIGDSTAEQYQSRLSEPRSTIKDEQEIDVRGRNLAEGIPKQLTLKSNQIQEALSEPLAQITAAVKNALEQSPPELASDIAERGIVLTGGGALLKGFDEMLAAETGLPVLIADDPLTCVARGGGKALELIDRASFNLFNSD